MTNKARASENRLEETKRIGRVLRIVQLLAHEPRRWSRMRLAAEFEVSERMIDKDLHLIRHALAYEVGHAHTGYYFERGPELQPVELTVPEVLALALAIHQARVTGSTDAALMGSVQAKLEEALPPGIVPHLKRATVQPVMEQGRSDQKSATLLTLAGGMATRHRVAISYRSAEQNEVTERTIAPYALRPYQDSWQIVADDSRRGEVRTFRVDRIQSATVTSEQYTIPETFDVREYFGERFGIIRGEGGSPHDVVLAFDAPASYWAEAEIRHPNPVLEWQEGGRLVIRFRSSLTHELVRWVLSFGPTVEIDAPEELRDKVRQEATELLSRLRSD